MSSLRVIPRNLSSRRHKLGNADAFVVSIPKSGRTWLRFFLQHYLCSRAGLEFSIHAPKVPAQGVPHVRFEHDLWSHVTAPRFRDRASGRYLIPRGARRSKKIVLAHRDLRDVMVSLHLQLTERSFRSGATFQGTRAEMIRDRRFGVERAVDILDAWLREWRGSGRLHVWSYEECQKDPESVFAETLRFLDCPVDTVQLCESLEFSRFDRMQEMEREDRFGDTILRPGNPGDPESYKVRRGVVGGHRDTLDADEIAAVDRAVARLAL